MLSYSRGYAEKPIDRESVPDPSYTCHMRYDEPESIAAASRDSQDANQRPGSGNSVRCIHHRGGNDRTAIIK